MSTGLLAYVSERGRPRTFLAAAAAIALAGQAGHTVDIVRFGQGTAFALLLIAQFRLWDDLADIERDRLLHPERVLSRTAHVDRFVGFGLTLATTNIALAAWSGGVNGVVILILLDATFAAWYALRPRHRTIAADLVVLTKYPIFTFIVAGSSVPSPAHVAAAIGIYVAACAFDVSTSQLRQRVHL